jgi:hypothetical protein
MNAMLCVYRRCWPSQRDLMRTEKAAETDPVLGRFLDSYFSDKCYLDWGDDPAFFSAQYHLGDNRMASWGVCRRDVRAALVRGDYVVFFCGRADPNDRDHWEYFFVGVGTISRSVPRIKVWQEASLAPYRQFYNVLAEWTPAGWIQRETFYPYHRNWRERAASPYILFDPDKSAFDLRAPLHVASYTGTVPEVWRTDDPRIHELRDLLFTERGISRGLRTARRGYGHAKLNLAGSQATPRPGRPLPELRTALLDLVEAGRPPTAH